MTDTSRIVAVIDTPVAITKLPKIVAGLEAIYGNGLTISQGRWTRFEIRTPGGLCWCSTCEDRDAATVRGLTGDSMRTISRFMIVCPGCGNKRCPRATDHDQDCTGSNEPGQEGSSYADWRATPARRLCDPEPVDQDSAEAAADELQRLHDLGQTCRDLISDVDWEWFCDHPLTRTAPPLSAIAPALIEWLRS